MLRRRYLSSLVFCVLGLSACSENRIARLEETTKQLRSDLQDLRSLQAEQAASLNQFKSDIRGLSGRVEETQHLSVGKARELEETLTQLKSRVPPPPGIPEDLLVQDEERIARIQGAAADQFRRGLDQVRSGAFDGARETFSAFVESNGGTAFTDDGLFWLAISADKLGQYDRAVGAYTDIFQKYGAEDMVAPALYYLSETFLKLGSKNDAIISLQKLVDEHGRTPYGAKGRAKLLELQGPPAGRSGRSKGR